MPRERGEDPKERGIDIAEWMAWRDRCEKEARVFFEALAYARNEMLPRLSREHRTQVRELIDLLDYVRKVLRIRIVPGSR